MAKVNRELEYTLADGWFEQVRRVPSPNCEPRSAGCDPDLLVIHNISLPPGHYGGECIEHLFTNCLDWEAHPFFDEIRGIEVSAHLLIRRGGEVLQFVSLRERAWHAGQSCFEGRSECNDFSIGIELEGTDDDAYTDDQYLVLSAVTNVLMAQYPGITAQRIVGHSDIAPGRKTDPGPAFDWIRYRQSLTSNGDEG